MDKLNHLECKLARAESDYNKWLDIALSCECDSDMLEVAANKVSPKWSKVVKLRREVEELKFRMKWSNTLSGYRKS